jgi:hypothetical protein
MAVGGRTNTSGVRAIAEKKVSEGMQIIVLCGNILQCTS